MNKVYEKTKVGNSSIEVFRPDYKGIVDVLNAFIPLYKACDDKKVIDRVLEKAVSTGFLITTEDEN